MSRAWSCSILSHTLHAKWFSYYLPLKVGGHLHLDFINRQWDFCCRGLLLKHGLNAQRPSARLFADGAPSALIGNNFNLHSYLTLPRISKATGSVVQHGKRRRKSCTWTLSALPKSHSWHKLGKGSCYLHLHLLFLPFGLQDKERTDGESSYRSPSWQTEQLSYVSSVFLHLEWWYCFSGEKTLHVDFLNCSAIATVPESNSLQNNMWYDSRVDVSLKVECVLKENNSATI